MTYSYLAAFNAALLLAPTNLSYDWQMGSVALVQSPLDPRNIFSLLLAIVLGAFLWKCRARLLELLRMPFGVRAFSASQCSGDNDNEVRINLPPRRASQLADAYLRLQLALPLIVRLALYTTHFDVLFDVCYT